MKVQEKLVSILMPVFNCNLYVEKAILSILEQSYKNIELLIIDDGSKDSSWKTISKFKDNRIRKFRFKKNVGNIISLNFLLKKTKGDYITFQDADDWSDLRRIKTQVDFLEENINLSLCGTKYRYVELNNVISDAIDIPLSHDCIIDFIIRNEYPPLCAASCMVRKEVVQQIGGLNEYFNRIGAGDFDWHFRILEKFQLANIGEHLYYYRKNTQSLTSTVSTDIRKMVSYKIAFFLYTQRITKGIDSLGDNNLVELELFTKQLLPQYFEDSGLIYYKIAESEIKKHQNIKSFLSIIICMSKTPFKKRNLTLIKLLLKNIFYKNNVDL